MPEVTHSVAPVLIVLVLMGLSFIAGYIQGRIVSLRERIRERQTQLDNNLAEIDRLKREISATENPGGAHAQD